jgi:hypothetical protein
MIDGHVIEAPSKSYRLSGDVKIISIISHQFIQFSHLTSLAIIYPSIMPSAVEYTLYAAALGLAYIVRYTVSLSPLFSNTARTILHFPLDEFSGIKYWALFIYFIARSILYKIPFLRKDPESFTTTSKAIPKTRDGDHRKEQGDVLLRRPISLEIPFRTSPADLLRYNRAAKTSGDTLSSSLHTMLFLSAVTEPAMLLLLGKWNCPIDPVGSVNVRNRFEIVNPTILDKKLREVMSRGDEDTSVVRQRWKVRVKIDENLTKVKRGWEVVVIVELVGGEDILYRQFFTFLQFANHSIPPPLPTTSNSEKLGPNTSNTTITLSSNDPSLWAELSKDYNPIHFSSLIARLFGFKGKIAHGNQVLAKGLARLDSEEKGSKGKMSMSWMEVEFRRPVFIPSNLDIEQSRGEEYDQVSLGLKDKVSITARFG